MCWNVLNDNEMDPPIHTEYLRSGGATTLIFIVEGARALSSLVMRSPIAANLKGSAPARYARKQHVSLLWYQNKVFTTLRPVVDQGLMWRSVITTTTTNVNNNAKPGI